MSTRTKILGAIAGVAVLAAGVLGVAATNAQEGGGAAGPGNDTTKRGEVFAQRVADNLGVTVDDLKAAVKDAQLQGVDDALANDRITQEQADKLRERIESSEGFGLRGVIKHHDRMQERRGEIRRALGATVAESIGITPEELRAEIEAGDVSIADVAAAHGISVDDVKVDVLAEAQMKLDAAVAGGRITQTRADTAMQRLTGNIDAMLAKVR